MNGRCSQPKPPQSPWDGHLHWIPSKANDFMALFNLVISSVWSGVRPAEVLQSVQTNGVPVCLESFWLESWHLRDHQRAAQVGAVSPGAVPAHPTGRDCHYSPSPLLSAPFCSLFGGGSVTELVMEWLKTSFSEGCNTNKSVIVGSE